MYDNSPIEVRVRIDGEEQWIPADKLLSHFDHLRIVAQRKEHDNEGRVIRSPDPPENFEPGDIWKDTTKEK